MMRPKRRRIIGWVSSRVRREDGRQVDFEHCVPVGVAHADEETVLGDAGIVDEDVDAFEFGLGLLAECLDFVAVREVRGEDLDAFAEFGGERLELLDAGAVQADEGAAGMKLAGDFLADAAGRAGYKGLAAGQVKHVPRSLFQIIQTISRRERQVPRRCRPQH